MSCPDRVLTRNFTCAFTSVLPVSFGSWTQLYNHGNKEEYPVSIMRCTYDRGANINPHLPASSPRWQLASACILETFNYGRFATSILAHDHGQRAVELDGLADDHKH